ncbi:hypothetical protein SALBM311S_11716 [Streptomyces alboniger]
MRRSPSEQHEQREQRGQRGRRLRRHGRHRRTRLPSRPVRRLRHRPRHRRLPPRGRPRGGRRTGPAGRGVRGGGLAARLAARGCRTDRGPRAGGRPRTPGGRTDPRAVPERPPARPTLDRPTRPTRQARPARGGRRRPAPPGPLRARHRRTGAVPPAPSAAGAGTPRRAAAGLRATPGFRVTARPRIPHAHAHPRAPGQGGGDRLPGRGGGAQRKGTAADGPPQCRRGAPRGPGRSRHRRRTRRLPYRGRVAVRAGEGGAVGRGRRREPLPGGVERTLRLLHRRRLRVGPGGGRTLYTSTVGAGPVRD